MRFLLLALLLNSGVIQLPAMERFTIEIRNEVTGISTQTSFDEENKVRGEIIVHNEILDFTGSKIHVHARREIGQRFTAISSPHKKAHITYFKGQIAGYYSIDLEALWCIDSDLVMPEAKQCMYERYINKACVLRIYTKPTEVNKKISKRGTINLICVEEKERT